MTKSDMKMCSLEFFETIHCVSIYDNYGYWPLGIELNFGKKKNRENGSLCYSRRMYYV